MEQIQPYRAQISERFPVASFHVRVPPERVFEIVCATDPMLLRSDQRHRRTRQNFYSSRSGGLLRAPTGHATWLVEPNQLRRFAGANRLYYALATYGSPRGDDPRLSTHPNELDRAPGIDISADFSGRSLDRSRFGLPLDEEEEAYGNPTRALTWGGDALSHGSNQTSSEDGEDEGQAMSAESLSDGYDDGHDPALWTSASDAGHEEETEEETYGRREAATETRVTTRLVACLEAFRRIPVTVAGTRVEVHPPYFINRENSAHRLANAQRARASASGATATLLQEVQRSFRRALYGKSTPADLREILQRAVDRRLFGERTPDAAALRQWLVRYGIGIDCSGFVCQALNDLVGHLAGHAPTGADLLDITGRNSASLRAGNRGFTAVSRPSELQAGDTMWKSGHIRLVSAVRTNSDGSVEFDTAESSSVADIGPTPNTWRYPRGDQFQNLHKRNTAGQFRPATESNVYSRYAPLERALGTTARSQGFDDSFESTSGVHALDVLDSGGGYGFEEARAFALESPRYADDVGEPHPEAEAEALIATGFDAAAERANRTLALEVGWGRITGGTLRILPALATALSISQTPTDTQLADAVTARQRALGITPANGRLDANTFRRMGVVPATRFRALRMTVQHDGHTLGIWEKTTPYGRLDLARSVGVIMNLGFRVTNPDAVRRAGFVLADGTPNFRIIQVLNYLRGVETNAEGIVSHLRALDPSSRRPQQAGSIIDPHPYYEDGLPGDATVSTFDIDDFRLQRGPNGLFYDLLFTDSPRAPRAFAAPIQRRIRAFETALVGVKAGNKNVLLNTVLWGYDVLVNAAGNPELREAALRPGTHGGSDLMKSVLARESAAGAYPGHCYVGAGFARAVRCA